MVDQAPMGTPEASMYPNTGQPIAPIPFGCKFNPYTGAKIPKFNPDTGVQNW